MGRPLAALALAALAVTAGCGAIDQAGSDGRTTDTLTPAAVPTDAATPTPDARLPPGVRRGGIDAGRLARAHADAVDGRSYRVYVFESRAWGADGTAVRNATRWVVQAENRTVYRYDRIETRDRLHNRTFTTRRDAREGYADGTAEYVRHTTESGVRYARRPVGLRGDGDGRFVDLVAGWIERYLAVGTVTVAAHNGTLVRVVGRGPRATGLTGTENYTVRALVAPTGFVHELRVRYELREGGRRVHVVVGVRYSSVGAATVDPPYWYTAARNATR